MKGACKNSQLPHVKNCKSGETDEKVQDACPAFDDDLDLK
jgi:hypothetical protein